MFDKLKKIYGSRLFCAAASLISFLIIFSRRPDALLNPQFWAEDGVIWYADAYNRGVIYSLTAPVAGYYQTISRLVGIFAQLFPFGYAPLIFNLAAIFIKILVVNFLLSARFSNLIPSLSGRVLIAFIYLAMPNSYETHANLTNAQWHLAILAFLIIVAAPSERLFWKTFDFAAILISALSGPFCLLLLPVAAVKWLKSREKSTLITLAILIFASVIQTTALLSAERPSKQLLGASIELFLKIVGGQLFVASIIGDKGYLRIIDRELWTFAPAFFVSLPGFGLLAYAFLKSNLELRLFIIFAALVCFGALVSPAITNEQPQWEVMWMARAGSRYWLIPIFCYLTALLYLAKNAEFRFVRRLSIMLLVLSLYGVVRDWKYPRYRDFEFQKYAAEFENAPVGEEVSIPINPDWKMRLIKK